jgi:hypothetical protein
VSNEAGVCGATVAVGSATATDNCSVGTPTGTRSDALALNAVYPMGTTTITWNVIDSHGNSALPKTQTVVVVDTQMPSITCPDNISLSSCVSTASWTTPLVTDNCPGVTFVQTAGPVSGSTFANGTTTTITYTAMDVAGNTKSCSFAVTRAATLASSSSATAVLCNGGNSTVTVSAVGGKAPYTGTGTFTRTEGTYSFAVTDADGCSVTTSITITQPTALSATIITNNSTLYYGYAGDQTATITATPSGGTAPYTIKITMVNGNTPIVAPAAVRVNGKLICNFINSAGKEIWTPASTTNSLLSKGVTCATSLIDTETSSTSITINGSYSVNVTLLADARFIATVTDVNGCSYTTPYTDAAKVDAEDARCFAGNSGNAKVTICHRTGSTKNPCVTICVDQAAVKEHLDHGDILGKCTSTCGLITNAKISLLDKTIVEPVEPVEFTVKAFPNPTNNQFNLVLEGGNNEKVEVIVYDMLARRVKRIEKNTDQLIVFGEEFPAGEYLVLIRQGDNAKTLNLIKK